MIFRAAESPTGRSDRIQYSIETGVYNESQSIGQEDMPQVQDR